MATLRRFVARDLDHAPPECRDTAVLIASELATNAVIHARTPYAVELRLGGVVRIGVADAALSAPVLREDPGDGGSRGLFIVSKLAHRWGVDWVDGGKVVWAEVPLAGA